jgi:hypothetical protein
MEEGWVYCLSNPAMPGYVKVGKTTREPRERAAELYTTGVPCEFVVEFAKKVQNVSVKEKQLHQLLEKHYQRPNPNREFFQCSSADVHEFFEIMDGTYLDEADKPNPYDLRKYRYAKSSS